MFLNFNFFSSKTFDDILEHVGNWGRFQWKLLGILIGTTIIYSYVLWAPILYLYVPDHWCAIPQEYGVQYNLTSQAEMIEMFIPMDEKTHKRSKCYIYVIEGILSDNKTKIKCHQGWQYNYTEYSDSASMQVKSYLI